MTTEILLNDFLIQTLDNNGNSESTITDIAARVYQEPSLIKNLLPEIRDNRFETSISSLLRAESTDGNHIITTGDYQSLPIVHTLRKKGSINLILNENVITIRRI